MSRTYQEIDTYLAENEGNLTAEPYFTALREGIDDAAERVLAVLSDEESRNALAWLVGHLHANVEFSLDTFEANLRRYFGAQTLMHDLGPAAVFTQHRHPESGIITVTVDDPARFEMELFRMQMLYQMCTDAKWETSDVSHVPAMALIESFAQ